MLDSITHTVPVHVSHYRSDSITFLSPSGLAGSIPADLRQYLNARFPKGGLDHELQNTVRDNLYLRTVPVTTRAPRPEERQGADYTFLSREEFAALERSGELLESGVYDGKTTRERLYEHNISRQTSVLPDSLSEKVPSKRNQQ